jgi:hypothetical protein
MPGAALTEPASVKPILVHPGIPAEPPPVAPAGDRPLGGMNQTPTFEPTAPAPVPDESRDGRGRAKQDARAEYEFD